MKGLLFILIVLSTTAVTVMAEEKPITVAVGQDFTVTLESNPSTGYQWVLARPLDEKLLKHSGREYKRANSRLVGAAGNEVLTFKALAEGKTEIKLKYGRIWEEVAGPARNTNFMVVIRKEMPKQAK